MNAVIYARYSSDNQREESIEGQIRECTAYAERNGITVVRHYIDRAISLRRVADEKLFDFILIWKIDCFARNRADCVRYKAFLKKNSISEGKWFEFWLRIYR